MRKCLSLVLGFMLTSAISAYAHPDITLKDQFGTPVTESHLPVDVRQSCSGCHDVDFIAAAYTSGEKLSCQHSVNLP